MTMQEVEALRFNVRQKDGSVSKDEFIAVMMEMLFLKNQIGGLFAKRRIKKEMTKLAERLGLNVCAAQDAETKRLFADAYREAARFFIKISVKDEVYSTGFLNLRRMSDKDVLAKITEDFAFMGIVLPEMAEMEDLFDPFRKGLQEALAGVSVPKGDWV